MAKASKKDINLYTLLVSPKKHTVKTGLIFGVIGIAAVVVMGGAFAGLKVYAGSQEKKVQSLEEKTKDPVLLEKLSRVQEISDQIGVLRTAGDVYKEVHLQRIQSQGYRDDFTTDLVEKLESCEDGFMYNQPTHLAEITGLSYSAKTLYITAQSEESKYISVFVDRLKGLGLFESLSYSGYTLQEENGYVYTVNAVFHPREYEIPTEPTTEASTEAASEEGEVS